MKDETKQQQGKRNRARGADWERRVRIDMISKGWNVSKFQSNVEFNFENKETKEIKAQIWKEFLEGKKVPLYGDGKNVRDWLYVEDNCSGIDVVLKRGQEGNVYNIGGCNQLSNILISKSMLKLFSLDDEHIKYVADRPGHDRRYALNVNKLKSLGWKPKESFDLGLKKTIDWYQQNFKWWKPLKRKANIIEW